MERIVIIGSGIAGHSAIKALMEAKDQKTRITLMTEETGSLYSPCAFPYYLAGTFPRKNLFLKHVKDYRDSAIDWQIGVKAERLDLKNQRVYGPNGSIPYDRLILAVGGEVSLPPISGIGGEGVFSLKTLADLDRIHRIKGKKAIIIGTGLVGIETAVALMKRKWEVSLFEIFDQVLPQLLDKEMAKKIKDILTSKGIQLFLKESVLEIKKKGMTKRVRSKRREVLADLVVLATGMKPRVELAKNSGLTVGSLGGIVVNRKMETSAPNVFACGDCVESKDPIFQEPALNLFWYLARNQGRVAGRNAAKASASFDGMYRMAATELFGDSIYVIGYTEKELKLRGLSPQVEQKDVRRGILRMVKWKDRIVGLQLLNAPEILPHLIGGIQYGVSLKELSSLNPDRAYFSPYPAMWRLKGLGIPL